MDQQEKFVARVLGEVGRGKDIHGDQSDLPMSEWLAILGEEFGEVAKDVCQANPVGLYSELVLVAAVSINMAMALCKQWDESPSGTPMKMIGKE